MKALTKQIGLVLILVLIVINVKAQKTFEEFKLITATYWYGEGMENMCIQNIMRETS